MARQLLEEGYTVKATVRDLNDLKKTEHLRGLDGAKERLHLFQADLREEGCFDPIFDGCEGVFHTPQVELMDPAVKGILNVLKSCKRSPCVRRVIVTSSMASVMYNGKPLTSDTVIDETWYSDPPHCQTIKPLYILAKTLAEEAAWKFAKDNGIDMVTLHPSFTIGPYLQQTINTTISLILNYIHGETFPNEIDRCVDVRDVAFAHIKAFELPSASGRYCLTGAVLHFSKFLKTIHEKYPNLHLPRKCQDDKPFVSKEKAKTLGVNFTSLEVTVVDTIEGLRIRVC